MRHEHADILKVLAEYRRRDFAAEIGRNRPRYRLAVFDVELGAVHGTREILSVKRSHFKRRVHVAAPSLHGMERSAAVANDYFFSINFHGFHSAGSDFVGADRTNKLFTQCPPPLAIVGEACRDRARPHGRTIRTNSV